MAHIYPDTINLCKSNAEKKVLDKFRAFSNKFHIIQNFPWVSTYITNIPGRFSPEGEVDFIILHEDFGMLALEIKGGNISYNNHAFFTNNDRLKQDPYEQSRNSSHLLREYINELSRDIIVGDAVAFPDSEKPQFLDYRQYITFDSNDLSNLENMIISIFEYWKDSYSWKRLDMQKVSTNIKLIIDKLLPNSIDPLSKKIEFDNKNWLNLSNNQTDTLTQALKHNKFFISGRAGTGKTILAIILARIIANNSKNKILFLTYNVELSEMIAKELKNDIMIDTLRFHQYLREQNPLSNISDSIKNEIDILEELIKTVQNKYDVLIIDESQSFGVRWLNLLNTYFQNKKIYIFSDELQSFSQEGNITNEQMTKIFNFDGTMTLSINYRSPFKVYKRLLEIFTSSIQQTTPRTLDNLDLKEIITDNPRNELYNTIDTLLEQNIKIDDMVILISSSQSKNIDAYKYKNIKVQTVQKYRGMEKPIVVYVLGSANKKDFNELYVAYSRSTTQTIVIIPEFILSLGKTQFEQILLESDITDEKIKQNIDSGVIDFYNNLTEGFKTISLLDEEIYYSYKYIFLKNREESFIQTLLCDYFQNIKISYIKMSPRNIKDGIFYSEKLIDNKHNSSKFLSFDYCKDCNTESYKTYDFCLNCNLEELDDFDINSLSDFDILNNHTQYTNEEKKSIHDSLRTIGRYYYSKLNNNLSEEILVVLNNQSDAAYISCILEILILLLKHPNQSITIKEIRDNIQVKLYNLNEDWPLKTGIVINMLLKGDIFKKIDEKQKGIYIFEREKIFKQV